MDNDTEFESLEDAIKMGWITPKRGSGQKSRKKRSKRIRLSDSLDDLEFDSDEISTPLSRRSSSKVVETSISSELWFKIFSWLPIHSVSSVARVCKAWNSICQSTCYLKQLFFTNTSNLAKCSSLNQTPRLSYLDDCYETDEQGQGFQKISSRIPLKTLLRRFTSFVPAEPHDVYTFLKTFSTYTTPSLVIRKLAERYEDIIRDESGPRVVTECTLKVGTLLQQLISNHAYTLDEPSIPLLKLFIRAFLREQHPDIANVLLSSLESKLEERKRLNAAVPSTLPSVQPPSDKQKKDKKFKLHAKILRAPSRYIAEQLAIRQFELYSVIKDYEFTAKDRTLANAAPRFRDWIVHNDMLSKWAAHLIIKEPSKKGRAHAVNKFIKVAKHLREIQDFSSLQAVVGALDYTPVTKCCSKIFKDLSSHSKKVLMELQELISIADVYKNYREHIKKCKPPLIPPVVVVKRDLTYMMECNGKSSDESINFAEKQRTLEFITNLQRYQRHPFNFVADPQFVLDFSSVPQSEDELFDLADNQGELPSKLTNKHDLDIDQLSKSKSVNSILPPAPNMTPTPGKQGRKLRRSLSWDSGKSSPLLSSSSSPASSAKSPTSPKSKSKFGSIGRSRKIFRGLSNVFKDSPQRKPSQIDWNTAKISFNETLGKGGSATGIRRVTLEEGNLPYTFAAKYFEIKDVPQELLEPIFKEIQIMEYLQSHSHPRIVRYMGKRQNENEVCIFMEFYMDSLHSMIRKRKEAGKLFTADEIIEYLRQIAEGVVFLHSHRIIHRDLKSENVFVVERAESGISLRIGDFGEAKIIEGDMTYTLGRGTKEFSAPELFGRRSDKKGYNEKADVWSIGGIMFELLSLDIPYRYEKIRELALASHIESGARPVIPPEVMERAETDPKIKYLIDLMEKCMEKNVIKRLTSFELLTLLEQLKQSSNENKN